MTFPQCIMDFDALENQNMKIYFLEVPKIQKK